MKNKIKRITTVAYILFLTVSARADLAGRIDSIINSANEKKTRFAINIVRADTGQPVYSFNAFRPMIPASNMKIITTAAALKYLGPTFEYKTTVGLCKNTLVITGSGDPLLGDIDTDARYNRSPGWILDDIAAKLKAKGVREIDGIIVDSTIFDDQRAHPNWLAKDLNKWWACEVCGLNYRGNCIQMIVTANGGRATISIDPATNFLKITNQVQVIRSGSEAVGTNRQPGKFNEIIVDGKCKKQQGPFEVAIEKPAAYFGVLLSEKLTSSGISVKGMLEEKAIDPACKQIMIAEYKTSITDCLWRCNKDSFSLAAEAMMKTMAAKMQGGKGGSWDGGRRIISQYLMQLGINEGEFYIDDGCGLSRNNRLSANVITKVLCDVYKSKDWQIYKDSLAAGGLDGTAAKYFKEDKYKGRILGKTGYINFVRSFSGICTTDSGDYIFSILTEGGNKNTRDSINEITKAIFEL